MSAATIRGMQPVHMRVLGRNLTLPDRGLARDPSGVV